jgi:hypothetical protein
MHSSHADGTRAESQRLSSRFTPRACTSLQASTSGQPRIDAALALRTARPKQQFQSGILISGFYWNHVCDFILKRAARHEVLSKYFYSGGVIIFEVLPYDRMVQLAANLTKTRAIKPPVQNLRTGAARAATGPCARRTAGIPPCSRPPSASRGRRSRSPSPGRCRHLDGPYL